MVTQRSARLAPVAVALMALSIAGCGESAVVSSKPKVEAQPTSNAVVQGPSAVAAIRPQYLNLTDMLEACETAVGKVVATTGEARKAAAGKAVAACEGYERYMTPPPSNVGSAEDNEWVAVALTRLQEAYAERVTLLKAERDEGSSPAKVEALTLSNMAVGQAIEGVSGMVDRL